MAKEILRVISDDITKRTNFTRKFVTTLDCKRLLDHSTLIEHQNRNYVMGQLSQRKYYHKRTYQQNIASIYNLFLDTEVQRRGIFQDRNLLFNLIDIRFIVVGNLFFKLLNCSLRPFRQGNFFWDNQQFVGETATREHRVARAQTIRPLFFFATVP